VYEKALIERYIEENGTDPISGEALTKEDLVEVKASEWARGCEGASFWPRVLRDGVCCETRCVAGHQKGGLGRIGRRVGCRSSGWQEEG
jgi:hypothetical protein